MEHTEQEESKDYIRPPDLQVHKASLAPEVAQYATNIEQQLHELCATYAITDIASFPAYARTHAIAPADLQSFATLLNTLTNITETGKVPFNETAYFKDLLTQLDTQWEILRNRPDIEEAIIEANMTEKQFRDSVNAIATKDHIPPVAVFQQDSRFMEKMLKSITADLSWQKDSVWRSQDAEFFLKGLSGAVVTSIFNQALQQLPDTEWGNVTQGIITSDPSGLGYDFIGGNLRITQADFSKRDSRFVGIGKYMSGGMIESHRLPPYSGFAMKGGKLAAVHAMSNIGGEMKGGEIHIQGNGGDFLGMHMQNGSISCRDAGENTGEGMEGGHISVSENCGNDLGISMRGGRIIVEGDADNYVGFNMRGGFISVRSCNDNVGEEMSGGNIQIREHMGTLGTLIRPGAHVECNGQVVYPKP